MDNTEQELFTDLFKCNSCTHAITPADPRIQCLICRNYDLCTNCAIGERFTGRHLASHQTQVYKESGCIDGHPPVLSRNMIMYPPSSPTSTRHPSGHDPHQTNTPQPSVAYPANSDGPPPLPARPRPDVRASNNPPVSGYQWQPFFLDMGPTPTFVTLSNDIFTYLDSSNSGFLTPETYSRFLDDQGYLPNENIWKSSLQATFNASKETMADKALKNAYDLFSIDHVLQPRAHAPHVDTTGLTQQFQRVLGSAFNPSLLQSSMSTAGPMPLLTRKGFLDITTIELLADPSKHWGNMSRMLRKYNMPRYRTWGDLPRSVVPELPHPMMLERVAAVTNVATQKGQRELEAARVESMLKARGQQNALDLIDGGRYYYYR